MLLAVIGDLSSADIELTVPVDSRLSVFNRIDKIALPVSSADSLRVILAEQASMADAIILIAPECGGCLSMCCEWLEPFQAKFLSPRRGFVELTANKQQTAEWLTARGVLVPNGRLLSELDSLQRMQNFRFPVVVKPVDGAGSDQIQVVEDFGSLSWPENPQNFRVESFVRGTAVSVSVLCGGNNFELLPPTGQVFDSQPIGNYVGTLYPLPGQLATRATALAAKTMSVLPLTRGYIGIDMILSSENSTLDCVVEVNPRLTMSYVKLRKICDFNLGMRMIEIAKRGLLPQHV